MALDLGWLSEGSAALCAAKVAAAAGSQAFGFLLTRARAPQPRRLWSNRKSIRWAPNCCCFTGLSPSQADQRLPNTTLPPTSPAKLDCPAPKYLYRYITSKYVLATWKTLVLRKHLVSHLEEKWECLFCTLPPTEPIPVSS